jgi:hypothetical protein
MDREKFLRSRKPHLIHPIVAQSLDTFSLLLDVFLGGQPSKA